MTIHLTRSARQDLEAIRTFTVDRWGRQQWLIYYRGMAAVLEQIAAAPDAGRNRDVLFPGVRSISYKAHLIFYRRTEAADGAPVVLRIVHQRGNLPALRYMESL
jgi:toxin ParE1/3/4